MAGTTVSATARLANNVNAMVSARSTKSCFVILSVKIIGTYTQTVVSVDAENSRIKATVEMFGRETPVELRLDQIRKLTEN